MGYDRIDCIGIYIQDPLKKVKLTALIHIYFIRKVGDKKEKETLVNLPYVFELKPGDAKFPGYGVEGGSHAWVKEALRSDGSLVVGCDIDFFP